MSRPRQYTDDQLRKAIENGSCWADVNEALGRARHTNATSLRKTAEGLGIDVTRLDSATKISRPPGQREPFRNPRPHGSGKALGTAITWFASRGYIPSLPIGPAEYDLVADSGQGLMRIRAITAASEYNGPRTRAEGYHAWRAQFGRRMTPGTADFVFIVAGDGKMYLIPEAEVSGQAEIAINLKYAAFEVT